MENHLNFWTGQEPAGTALPTLEKAVTYFRGPSLEFGGGDFSTSLLTSMLAGIEFHTFENDTRWSDRLIQKGLYQDSQHHLHLVDTWGDNSQVLK